MKNKVHINFWNYHKSFMQNAESVSRMKEMGFTSVITGEGRFDDEGAQEKIKDLLEACELYDMPAVIHDECFRMRNYRKKGEEEYRKDVKKAVNFYERFPMAKYAFVWDEPTTDEDWQLVNVCANIIREEATVLKPFCALNHTCGKPKRVVKERLRSYLAGVQPDVLLYNCYSQCFEKEEEKEQGLENFFFNLKVFAEVAKEEDVSLATSLICCGHWMFRVPTQDDLRWQLNVCAAHGVQGFYWFHPFDLPRFGSATSYRGFPIDKYGKETSTYEGFAYENKQFMEMMEKHGLLKGAKLEKVYHAFRSYGGFPYFEKGEDEFVYDVSSHENQPLILSRFVKVDGSRVIMVVNASQTKGAGVTVVFNENLGIERKFEWLAPGSAMLVDLGADGKDESEKSASVYTLPLSCAISSIGKSYPAAELACKVIESNLDRNLSIGDIASLVNIDEYYLMHLFKKQYGESIVSYRNKLRIKKAKKLLEETDMKIIDIGIECGFENTCYFSRLFKQSEQVTPVAYRTLYKKETKK